MGHKAIFFDRDDTLIQDKGYMHDPTDLIFFPESISTLRELQEKGFLLFIVTNQSGIGRGYFQEADMHKFNQHMLAELKTAGIEIKDIVFCPHAPENNCECRKPSPKLINDLCEKYDIDKNLSYMVGDKESDIKAGENAGLTSIKITSGEIKKILSILN